MLIKEEKETVYKTSDGERFLDMNCAIDHQIILNLNKWADDVGLCRGGEWDQRMVIDAILENLDKFEEILLLDKVMESNK